MLLLAKGNNTMPRAPAASMLMQQIELCYPYWERLILPGVPILQHLNECKNYDAQ